MAIRRGTTQKTNNNPVQGATQPNTVSGIERIGLIIGSAGLLGAMATDTLAVLGRHTGFAVLGSIEIVQAAIVLLATAAMVIATKTQEHATVHILTDRLKPSRATTLARLSTLISAFFCLLLASGSIWVVAETWNAHERSELLHISITGLRLLLIAALVLMVWFFIRRCLQANKS